MVSAFSNADVIPDDAENVSSTVTPFAWVPNDDVDIALVAIVVAGAVVAVVVLSAASKAFASLSCSVTEPSLPTDALHISTRGALRFVNGRCMLLGTCGGQNIEEQRLKAA